MPICIAGVDEAGRGPLAGPVIAAAVILNPDLCITGLKDSKQLTVREREALFEQICARCLAYGVGRAEPEEIDRVNILQATLLAMQRAVFQLSLIPTCVRVDGNVAPVLPYPTETLVRGDQLDNTISAASIIAKVLRDREMVLWDAQYPAYGFAVHKGYPTAKHREALKRYGVTAIHRRSFGPVKALLLFT